MDWHGLAGVVRRGAARQGTDRQARRGRARQGLAGRGTVWIGMAGKARHGRAWLGAARQGTDRQARRGRVRLGLARHGKAGKEQQVKPEAVKAIREKAGLSIAQAARCVQIADRSWQRYESGDREIPPGLVELFCLKNGLKYPPK